MKSTFSKLLLLAVCLGVPLSAQVPKIKERDAAVTEEIRREAAQGYLKDKPRQIAVHSKGLVCSSCAIGLRVHISKLDNIDTQVFNKGVDLDAEKQLLLVAFKDGATPDMAGLQKAIHKAGYVAAYYYVWSGDAVDLKYFPEEK